MDKNETRVLLWDKKEHTKYEQVNKGKWITDTNPYLEINPESFDLYTEIALQIQIHLWQSAKEVT